MNTFVPKTNWLIFTLALILTSTHLNAQDISGEWNGVITQEEGGLSDEYYFSIYIQQKGSEITGFTKVELYQDKKRIFFARKKIKGTFDGKNLFFKELEIVDQEMYSISNICLIEAKLKFVLDKSALCLKGTWGGVTTKGATCSPGKIKVCSNIPIAKI